MTGNITKVQVNVQNSTLNYTKLASITGKNLQNQIGDKISDKGFLIIYDCQIQKDGDIFIIKGQNDTLFNKSDVILYVVNNSETIVNVSATLNYKNNEVELQLTPNRTINADMNGTLGKTNDDKNIYLVFDYYNSSELQYKPKYYFYHNKKSSGGLSGGAIVAIILPCIAVLVGIGVLAFFLGRKPTVVSPNQNVVSNSLGINSSTNVVN